jgi:hypothetical protein
MTTIHFYTPNSVLAHLLPNLIYCMVLYSNSSVNEKQQKGSTACTQHTSTFRGQTRLLFFVSYSRRICSQWSL